MLSAASGDGHLLSDELDLVALLLHEPLGRRQLEACAVLTGDHWPPDGSEASHLVSVCQLLL